MRDRHRHDWEEDARDRYESDIDSDAREDDGQERLLDESFDNWYESIGRAVARQERLVSVPKQNVFDAAVEVEENVSKKFRD
ncbi:hypothetical protein [uncultured Paenibacillus sp.]|uniref:hypothetical protein n=1 Tax=uncultured Paenibacillus sp. TaxID=227322 RepID=UPI0028D4C07E|nr:hypothetical protein [uncultured Paenibacillus sp.]